MAESSLVFHPAERKALTVTELTQRVKELVERNFRAVWVRGEISNFVSHTSGHWYFTLKDSGAQLRCACFRYQNRLIRFKPEDGLEIYARGRLSVYEKRGEYQLIVEFMEPGGMGSLQLAFEQLKARLEAEGLFDPLRKKALPLLPRKVGVVTSATGAAIRDILQVLARRNSGVSVLVHPARVQGTGAAQEVAEAIENMNKRDDLDVLIVGRGGGSIEDLWAFNEEVVARAIFASRIPLISAVGHETDFTIADFVADVRAPTPSAAAELVAARRDELVHRVTAIEEQLTKALHLRLARLRHRVSTLEARPGFRRTTGLLQQYLQRADDLDHRLHIVIVTLLKSWRRRLAGSLERVAGLRLSERLIQQRRQVDTYEQRLTHCLEECLATAQRRVTVAAGKLSAMSPLAVLARGYAIVWGPDGTILRRATDVMPGDSLSIRLARGRLTCVTREVKPDDQP